MPQPERDYIGYEDYSPEGRAAIKAFNEHKGFNFLRQRDPRIPYQTAVDAARKAALIAALQRYQQNLSLGQMQGTESYAPPTQYVYPPKE